MAYNLWMRRWIGRLSFTFLIVAFLLFYEGHKLHNEVGDGGRVRLYYFGAVACVLAGMIGVRYRHVEA